MIKYSPGNRIPWNVTYESLFVELIPKSGKHIVVGVIYRPNTLPPADVDVFRTTLFGVMDEINNENKKCVIMGDMNINVLKYGAHKQTDTYVDGIFSRGFFPRIIMPTRVTHRSATLIDHILTNEITSASSSGIIINDVADHFAIFNISTTTPNKPKPQIRHIRSFSEENISNFNLNLTSLTLHQFTKSIAPTKHTQHL